MSDLTKEDLSVGAWFLMEHGFEQHEFCILDIEGDYVKIGLPSWCVSSAIWSSVNEMNARGTVFMGIGKTRWWRVLLLGFKDVIFPFSKPKRNF